MKVYFVYIMTNYTNTVLYTGVTNNIYRRVLEHKFKDNPGFTSKYNCNKLVYYEEYGTPMEAIRREKIIKRWKRKWKKSLIVNDNPNWKDLSQDWYSENTLNAK